MSEREGEGKREERETCYTLMSEREGERARERRE
jgi:hypothetical protein